MQKWDKELFVELHETLTILPPLCGIPKGLDKYFKDGKLYQPVIRRKNYITNEWSHFNMARAERPIAKMDLKMEQKECMFCPENENKTPRHVKTNGDYIRIPNDTNWKVRVFPNLFPWMIEHMNIVETAKHKISISELDLEEEILALTTAQDIVKELEKNNVYPILFRNQGWGASISHYHWQIGALPYLPNRLKEELNISSEFYKKYNTNIFDAIIISEQEQSVRVIADTEKILVLSPFAPRTAFEVWLIFKTKVTSLSQLTKDEIRLLAEQLYSVLKKLYNKVQIDTLNIIFHQIPSYDTNLQNLYRLHIEIMPHKFLAGAEKGFLEFAIEITPEHAAELLKQP
jgi:UDPglucose--hexose-1-phosphate uridylyltransferase